MTCVSITSIWHKCTELNVLIVHYQSGCCWHHCLSKVPQYPGPISHEWHVYVADRLIVFDNTVYHVRNLMSPNCKTNTWMLLSARLLVCAIWLRCSYETLNSVMTALGWNNLVGLYCINFALHFHKTNEE